MENVIRNVSELTDAGRRAVETLLGHALSENQQLVIRVVDAPAEFDATPRATDSEQLPAWCDVCAGLGDERIQELDKAISRRLDLTRGTT